MDGEVDEHHAGAVLDLGDHAAAWTACLPATGFDMDGERFSAAGEDAEHVHVGQANVERAHARRV
jgi:hypothetical protein